MKQIICAVYDKKTGHYSNPLTYRHIGDGIREWDLVRNSKETKYGQFPSDYDFVQIGTYDDQQGLLETLSPHTHLASGV